MSNGERNTNVHFMSESSEWSTPQGFFDRLHGKYGFTLDPCATAENAKCTRFYTKDDDGLKQSWQGERVFMNPPYGREIGHWIAKAYQEAQEACLVVALLPARTDTAWFHDYCKYGHVNLLRGRLKFGGQKSCAPFPSMIVIW